MSSATASMRSAGLVTSAFVTVTLALLVPVRSLLKSCATRFTFPIAPFALPGAGVGDRVADEFAHAVEGDVLVMIAARVLRRRREDRRRQPARLLQSARQRHAADALPLAVLAP